MVTEASLDSLMNVVSSSDASQVLRNIHRHALQYSMEMLMPFSLLLLFSIGSSVVEDTICNDAADVKVRRKNDGKQHLLRNPCLGIDERFDDGTKTAGDVRRCTTIL